MKRINTLITLSAAFICSATLFAQAPHVLENEQIRAKINPQTGVLTQLTNKATGWQAIGPHPGCSFEAGIKLPDGSYRTIEASTQQPPVVTIHRDTLSFRWDELQADGQATGIRFTGHIILTDEGLQYEGELENRSDKAVVEQLSWPMLKEITLPAETRRLLFQYMTYSKFNTLTLYPNEAGRGWSNLPEHAFTLIHNTREGLYLSSKDHQFQEYIRCEYELFPTDRYASSVGTAWSKRDAGERKLMRTQIKAARMLYAQPHTATTLVPVVLTAYTGSWHKGADIYKRWRSTWYVAPHKAEWLTHVNAWQQLQINTSESRINFTLKGLRKYVDECRKYGVHAIQLTGWNQGGQDRGIPVHDLDPRLGTPQEFKKEIARAKKKGVNILLFTKFTWADLTATYHDQYLPHLAWTLQGDTCIHPGYNYNTYTQLIGVNTRRFGIFCMMDTTLRAKLRHEFQKCLDLGAPGMVYDENQHHAGVIQCFNPHHGHPLPGSLYRGATLLGREFYEMCQRTNPDFLMVGEGPYDILSQYYATYTRGEYDHEPVLRYIDSDIPIAYMVNDHNDRNRINAAVANAYAISYEPRNFKGYLHEVPRLMEYGRQVDTMRRRYEEFLWNGEFMDTQGATVSEEGIRHTVFRNKRNGKRAVVVYNPDFQRTRTATVHLDNSSSALMMASPEHPALTRYEGSVELAPQSLAVLFEQ